MTILMYSVEQGYLGEREYTASELGAIAARQPTAEELLQQQIQDLKNTITQDIRDKALLGDTADLQAIYDQIKALQAGE